MVPVSVNREVLKRLLSQVTTEREIVTERPHAAPCASTEMVTLLLADAPGGRVVARHPRPAQARDGIRCWTRRMDTVPWKHWKAGLRNGIALDDEMAIGADHGPGRDLEPADVGDLVGDTQPD